MIRSVVIPARQFGDRNDFMIGGLCGVCLLWGFGLSAITRQLKSANWTRPG